MVKTNIHFLMKSRLDFNFLKNMSNFIFDIGFPVITAFASFILAFVIARMTIRKMNKWKRGWIITLSSAEYIIIQVLLYSISFTIQTSMICSAVGPLGQEGCGWYMFLPIMGAFIVFPIGLVIFIVTSIKYSHNISVLASTDAQVRWNKTERLFFLIALIVYFAMILISVPLAKLAGLI